MNKLTEEQLSDIWNKADNSRREESYLSQDVFDLILHVQHLSALLEEKDKALEEAGKYLDAAIEEINYSLNDNKSKEVKRVYADNAIRFIGCAHKTLNASSNNEGELK